MSIEKPVSYSVPGEQSSPKFAAAFAKGCGGEVCTDLAYRPGPVAAFWSPPLWPILNIAKGERRTFYYGDHGYFGNSGHFRITKNRLQHSGDGHGNVRRFRKFGRSIQQWRRSGTHILVCLQCETYFGLHGVVLKDWLADVIRQIKAATDRPIIVRARNAAYPIQRDLIDCWAVVTFSSASALDALIAGIPVFVLAEFASAYKMGRPDLSAIESPLFPADRERFMAVLASNQWTLLEIERGIAWRALNS